MKKFLILMSALFLSAAFAFAQTTQPATPVAAENPNAPVITFDNTTHDYGTINQGGDGTCYFKFTNSGKEPLILQQPRSSCGCTVPTWPKEPILPGESNEIKVTYNTSRVGPINKTVTIISNAKNNNVVLRIKGNVVAATKEPVPEKQAGEGAPINK